MEKVELKIKGMHCTGCSTRLEKVLNNQDGISKAEVSFEQAKANIEYEEGKTNIEEIKETIEDAGFEAE